MTRRKPTPFSVDELGFIQLAAATVLCAVARGELDLNAIARGELASRGLDRTGEWVGFEKAARLAKQLPIRGADGRTLYVTVPDDMPQTAYVIRDNDGQYLRRFDAERRAIILSDKPEQAKRFDTRDQVNRFLRRHAGAWYGLSDAATAVPIEGR